MGKNKPKINYKKIAENVYERTLKNIEKNYTGDKTTYQSELTKNGKLLFGMKYKGTFSSDKIPRLTDLKPYCILNLDRSDEAGSHWVALCKIENEDRCIFYDSFGRNDTTIINSIQFSGNGRIINSEDDAEQKLLETNCGARSLAFISVFNKYGENIALLI